VSAVLEHRPDFLPLSALLTIGAHHEEAVIGALEREGIRQSVEVIVDGGAIKESFSKDIGADRRDADAQGGVGLARSMLCS